MWVTSSVLLLNHGRERRESHSFSETVTSCLAPDQPIFFSQSFMSCIVFKFCFLFWYLFWFQRKWPAFTSHQVCYNTHTNSQHTHTRSDKIARTHYNVVSSSFGILSCITRHFSCIIGEEERVEVIWYPLHRWTTLPDQILDVLCEMRCVVPVSCEEMYSSLYTTSSVLPFPVSFTCWCRYRLLCYDRSWSHVSTHPHPHPDKNQDHTNRSSLPLSPIFPENWESDYQIFRSNDDETKIISTHTSSIKWLI